MKAHRECENKADFSGKLDGRLNRVPSQASYFIKKYSKLASIHDPYHLFLGHH